MNSLEYIFNLTKESSHHLKSKFTEFKGQEFWKGIKDILQQFDEIDVVVKWKILQIDESLKNNILDLEKYEIDSNGKTIETNHFIVQQVRIPRDEKPTIKKIIQIGLNIGQWYAIPEYKTFTEKDYIASKLDKIETYISTEAIVALSAIIDRTGAKENIEKYIKEQYKRYGIDI
jgi:hypothetical protein